MIREDFSLNELQKSEKISGRVTEFRKGIEGHLEKIR